MKTIKEKQIEFINTDKANAVLSKMKTQIDKEPKEPKEKVVKEKKVKVEVEKKTETAIPIVVPRLKLNILRVGVKGTTPLLMDRFPESVREQILEKQRGLTKGKKQLRDLDLEFNNALHRIDKENMGFPAQGFKSAMIESTSFVGSKDFSKKLLKGIQIINSVGNDLIPIKYSKISKLTHYPKGGNTKISPMFENWSCELVIQYDANNISPQDLVNLLNYAGFYYGIGMWSPRAKCGGKYGMYEVDIRGMN